MSEEDKQIQSEEHVDEVARKYRDLLYRQPNVHTVITGIIVDGNKADVRDIEWVEGIEVWVYKKVDQSTLPEEDRIPDCLDGVPVRIVETEGFKTKTEIGD